MAKCIDCGKKATMGRKVSYSHKRSKRLFKPNLIEIKSDDGEKIKVCAKCLKKRRNQDSAGK